VLILGIEPIFIYRNTYKEIYPIACSETPYACGFSLYDIVKSRLPMPDT
jgi:hypothetical protein